MAYEQDGILGVDIKSHQEGAGLPFPAVAAGNEAMDSACTSFYNAPSRDHVFLPSGGLFAFIVLEGRMVTGKATEAIRALLRQQALKA